MASSLENMGSIESWEFRPSFVDSWLVEAFSSDTEALTKALQDSISNSDSHCHSISPLFSVANSNTLPTPTGSNVSGSDHEATLKRQRTVGPAPPTGKVSKSKRKSRASKRSNTTFINADPTNFRQMVQQVTGVRFGNGQMSPSPILEHETHGPGSLPTLDTSAFLLDHCQLSSGAVSGSTFVPLQSSMVAKTGASSDCDSFPFFPTLESWTA